MNNEIYLPNGTVLLKEDLEDDLKKDNIILLKPDINKIDYIKKLHSSFLQQNILANRYDDLDSLKKYYDTKLCDILTKEFIEDNMPEVLESTPIILDVIKNNGLIIHNNDSDVDGITSGAIVYKMFKKLFDYDNFSIVTSKRSDGYGVNKAVTEYITNKKDVALVMTSDHGSSDKTNLSIIKDKLNCKVIVTDHHLYSEETAPLNMDVFVNPQQPNNSELFKSISGSHVIYYTLLHAFLSSDIEKTEEKINYYYSLLSYVGLTVISDCMDLKNYVNKKTVKKMLSDLNNPNIKKDTFWTVTIDRLENSNIIDETTIGYSVAPIINSSGRLSQPSLGYELMISEELEYTKYLYEEILLLNSKRKDKQNNALLSKDIISYSNDVVKILLIKNSDGVQGIIANDVMFNENYKVSIVFTKKEYDGEMILQGSGRSQDENLSLKNLITSIANKNDIVLTSGGHAKAIGLKIKDDLKLFFDLLAKEIKKHDVKAIEDIKIDSYIYSDKKLILNLFDIVDIGPYGTGFEKPLFCSDLYIENFRIFKKNKYFVTLKVKLNKSSNNSYTLFYNVKDSEIDEFDYNIKHSKYIRVVYTLGINSFRNYNRLLMNGIKIIFK